MNDTVTCPICGKGVEVIDDDELGDIIVHHPKDPRYPASGINCPASGQPVDSIDLSRGK